MTRKRPPALVILTPAELRRVDQFASAALMGLCCGLPATSALERADSLAEASYKLAGAMLRARAAWLREFEKHHKPD